mmetsp:Transcript_2415/g.9365  ORF Transcript_2415/g.9365 Transcript_2415/m.9365 type:complete len:261 (+) Transcript_2415:2204-2986(+)
MKKRPSQILRDVIQRRGQTKIPRVRHGRPRRRGQKVNRGGQSGELRARSRRDPSRDSQRRRGFAARLGERSLGGAPTHVFAGALAAAGGPLHPRRVPQKVAAVLGGAVRPQTGRRRREDRALKAQLTRRVQDSADRVVQRASRAAVRRRRGAFRGSRHRLKHRDAIDISGDVRALREELHRGGVRQQRATRRECVCLQRRVGKRRGVVVGRRRAKPGCGSRSRRAFRIRRRAQRHGVRARSRRRENASGAPGLGPATHPP